jgi:hypothetical protein
MNPPYSLILTSSEAILQRISACRLALDKSSLFVQFLAAAMVLFVLAPSSVFAANQTWTNNGSVSANWSETTNWGGNAAPGATSGNASTDVATFNTSSGNYGTSGGASPIVAKKAGLQSDLRAKRGHAMADQSSGT